MTWKYKKVIIALTKSLSEVFCMYNKYLEIFIQVADTGSFSKAGEKLFMSPTAVMKQMNLMESELGLSLLNRTNHGITLTEVRKTNL